MLEFIFNYILSSVYYPQLHGLRIEGFLLVCNNNHHDDFFIIKS